MNQNLKRVLDDVRTGIDAADTALDTVPGAILPAKVVMARVMLDAVRKLVDSIDDLLKS